MKQADVKIGGEYRVKIGSRLAPVTVISRRERTALRGRRQVVFHCITLDTNRSIVASAARIRPIVAPPAVKIVRPPVEPSPVPAAWDGHPGDSWLPLVPVPGLLPRRGEGRVLRLSQANHAFVRRIVDREHVAEGMMRIARVVRAAIACRVQWRTIPRDLRRGILFTAACIHHGNRETYTAVMGHAPLPSPRAVAEAVGIAVGLGPEPVC